MTAGRKWTEELVTLSTLKQVKALTYSPMLKRYNLLTYNYQNAMDER